LFFPFFLAWGDGETEEGMGKEKEKEKEEEEMGRCMDVDRCFIMQLDNYPDAEATLSIFCDV
jgi:hypothetical protein